MNILGIDFGTKKCGLAWLQKGLDVVLPFGIIEEDSKFKPGLKPRESIKAQLLRIIKDENIGMMVFGLPFGPDGSENDNTRRVRAFAEELKKELKVPVEFVGEEFTSQEAAGMGGDASLDEKAAMLILEAYRETLCSP
ncbi:MAG: Holliday junction resolvase RuvX [Candidatus Magasanikbacteria bacterium]|nr:Holliday junction resolvase RuvX [Candidatus Magasanikbacteria bacterium]